ncbi:hypothetical protein B296_00039396 [Ensete ventricosum]|uniref:Uncharacterized protein n=1 Tax=Ensete ventricosum TaxID=4639 RepID=A0A426YI25_ENSVE|nr:hypothetical protein B296_00039396 [Ensete ventricosum]
MLLVVTCHLHSRPRLSLLSCPRPSPPPSPLNAPSPLYDVVVAEDLFCHALVPHLCCCPCSPLSLLPSSVAVEMPLRSYREALALSLHLHHSLHHYCHFPPRRRPPLTLGGHRAAFPSPSLSLSLSFHRHFGPLAGTKEQPLRDLLVRMAAIGASDRNRTGSSANRIGQSEVYVGPIGSVRLVVRCRVCGMRRCILHLWTGDNRSQLHIIAATRLFQWLCLLYVLVHP